MDFKNIKFDNIYLKKYYLNSLSQMNDFVILKNPYENWTLEKRRAGRDNSYSEGYKTYLCNYLYVIYSKSDKLNWGSLSHGIKPKICCCECSKQESTLTATWYQYSKYKCYICDRQIIQIYNKKE